MIITFSLSFDSFVLLSFITFPTIKSQKFFWVYRIRLSLHLNLLSSYHCDYSVYLIMPLRTNHKLGYSFTHQAYFLNCCFKNIIFINEDKSSPCHFKMEGRLKKFYLDYMDFHVPRCSISLVNLFESHTKISFHPQSNRS